MILALHKNTPHDLRTWFNVESLSLKKTVTAKAVMDTVIIAEEIIIKVRFENRETSNAPINEAILSNYKNKWSFILYKTWKIKNLCITVIYTYVYIFYPIFACIQLLLRRNTMPFLPLPHADL